MDWIAGVLTLTSTWLIYIKHWEGWLIAIICDILFISINIQYKLYGLLPVCLVLLVLHFKAAIDWKEK